MTIKPVVRRRAAWDLVISHQPIDFSSYSIPTSTSFTVLFESSSKMREIADRVRTILKADAEVVKQIQAQQEAYREQLMKESQKKTAANQFYIKPPPFFKAPQNLDHLDKAGGKFNRYPAALLSSTLGMANLPRRNTFSQLVVRFDASSSSYPLIEFLVSENPDAPIVKYAVDMEVLSSRKVGNRRKNLLSPDDMSLAERTHHPEEGHAILTIVLKPGARPARLSGTPDDANLALCNQVANLRGHVQLLLVYDRTSDERTKSFASSVNLRRAHRHGVERPFAMWICDIRNDDGEEIVADHRPINSLLAEVRGRGQDLDRPIHLRPKTLRQWPPVNVPLPRVMASPAAWKAVLSIALMREATEMYRVRRYGLTTKQHHCRFFAHITQSKSGLFLIEINTNGDTAFGEVPPGTHVRVDVRQNESAPLNMGVQQTWHGEVQLANYGGDVFTVVSRIQGGDNRQYFPELDTVYECVVTIEKYDYPTRTMLQRVDSLDWDPTRHIRQAPSVKLTDVMTGLFDNPRDQDEGPAVLHALDEFENCTHEPLWGALWPACEEPRATRPRTSRLIREFAHRPGGFNTKQKVWIDKVTLDMPGCFLALHGPPGTGKTYVGMVGVVNLALMGFQVLVTGKTNLATDRSIDAFEKVLKQMSDFSGEDLEFKIHYSRLYSSNAERMVRDDIQGAMMPRDFLEDEENLGRTQQAAATQTEIFHFGETPLKHPTRSVEAIKARIALSDGCPAYFREWLEMLRQMLREGAGMWNSKKSTAFRNLNETVHDRTLRMQSVLFTNSHHAAGLNGLFQALHIEEASQFPLYEALLVIANNPHIRCVTVSGDLAQLKPFSGGGKQNEFHEILSLSVLQFIALEREWDSANSVLLQECYRSHPDITQKFSHHFYDDRVIPAPSAPRTSTQAKRFRALSLNGFFGGAFQRIHKATTEISAPRAWAINFDTTHEMGPNGSRRNPEADVAISTFVVELLCKSKLPPPDRDRTIPIDANEILILTTYKADRDLIRTNLDKAAKLLEDSALCDVKVRTVDSYQGEESEIAIVHLVSGEGTPGFLADVHRFNVAISRAMHLQFIFGNLNFFRHGDRCKWAGQEVQEFKRVIRGDVGETVEWTMPSLDLSDVTLKPPATGTKVSKYVEGSVQARGDGTVWVKEYPADWRLEKAA